MKAYRADRLAGFLDEAETDARFWGSSDCLTCLARWVSIERPAFDASHLMGRCSGPISAGRILRKAGVDRLVSKEADTAGLEQIDPSQAVLGDIGLIRVPRLGRSGLLTFGAIRTASSWWMRTATGGVEIGVGTMTVAPHLAWKV